MTSYGQFCPISKAMEVLGERWTVLIIRELLLGATRFSELQRGLPRISPTMLNRRLSELTAAGLVSRERSPGQRGHAYLLTEAGEELRPVVIGLGEWGMRWARGTMTNEELDVEQLMRDIQRNFDPQRIPGRARLIVQFQFSDLSDFANWWLRVDGDQVDLCVDPPGEETEFVVQTSLRTLTQIWMGDLSSTEAIRNRVLKLAGPPRLTNSFDRWLGQHRLAHIRPVKHV